MSVDARREKMSLLGVIYFFEKGNVSHVADPICLTFYSLRSQKRVEKFHAGKSPEINGEMLQKEEECVNKRRNISFYSSHVSFLSFSWDRLSNEEEIVALVARTRTVFGVSRISLLSSSVFFCLAGDRRAIWPFDLSSTSQLENVVR